MQTNATSVDECAKECGRTTNCHAAVYNARSTVGNCLLQVEGEPVCDIEDGVVDVTQDDYSIQLSCVQCSLNADDLVEGSGEDNTWIEELSAL